MEFSEKFLGGLLARPVALLFLLFRRKAKHDTAVKRDAGNLDVEAFAVGVGKSYPYAGPEALFLVAVTYLVSNVARRVSGFFRFGFVV
jgi:hypothetical protein